MSNFELDQRLARDCLQLGKLKISHLLLMNNALVPWFILVPETDRIELTELSQEDQIQVLEEINLVSKFVKTNFQISKLNTAAIGNIVSQLHIHIIGRHPQDFCWPNVVWGTQQREPYTEKAINKIKKDIHEQLGDCLGL